MEEVHYETRLMRIIASFIVAIFITLRDRWHEIGIAIVTPQFYVAFAVTFGVAYALLYVVDRINGALEIKYPSNKRILLRLTMQTLYCYLIPVVLDLAVMFLYSKIVKTDFKLFLQRDFQFALLFLAIINGYYIRISLIKPKLRTTVDKGSSKILYIKHNGVDINLDSEKDILFVQKDGRNIMVHTISGSAYSKKHTISAFKKEFHDAGFCQVNPSAIINLHMLKGYATGSRSKTLEPLFKPQFQEKISASDLEKLRVTREYLTNFKNEIKKSLAGEVQI